MENKLKVTEIQRFCMHDGPGIRTTVFFKGCPLRCKWCHNPETQKRRSELLFYAKKCIFCRNCLQACRSGAHIFSDDKHVIDREKCRSCFSCVKSCPTGALETCGRDMTAEEILSVVKKDSAFYGVNGGITLSGGEPFAQNDGVVGLLKASKECGINTAVETCGYADPDVLRAAIPYVDLFLWDIKNTDEAEHKRYTGVSFRKIMKNLSETGRTGVAIRLRCIVVNGVNTKKEHYEKIADIAGGIVNLTGVELIPYHAYGGAKAVFLGEKDNANVNWIPLPEQVAYAKDILARKCVKTI